MNLELPALYAGYFGAWFGGLSGSEVAIQASRYRSNSANRPTVQQHDLPLGLAEEAEDAHAVKM